jgi:hypothetical protein
MKYLYLSFVFCISATSIFSQHFSFDQIISKNAIIRCEDVQYNAYNIIKGLYERKQIDSLYLFIDYWEEKCGPLEVSFRTKQLLNIEQGRFSPERINSEWIEFLIAYKAILDHGLPKPQSVEDLNISQQLDYLNTFLYNYARSIPSPKYSLDAQLVLAFYSAKHPTFDKISQASPEESRLSEFYHHEWKRTEQTAVWDILFNAGYYRPFWKLERFGGHPVLGMGYGYGVKRHTAILQLDFYAGPSRDDYTIVYNGSKITQRKWTGMYVGLEYYYQIIKKDIFSFAISPGIGYDGITVVPSENQYGEESKALRSINGSVGFQGRYRYDDQHSLGVVIRINRADFNNTGGTELHGGYVTFKIFWSFMDDVRTSTRRRLLK